MFTLNKMMSRPICNTISAAGYNHDYNSSDYSSDYSIYSNTCSNITRRFGSQLLALLVMYYTLSVSHHSQAAPVLNLPEQEKPSLRNIRYEIFDDRAYEVLNTSAPLHTLASGFQWAEGPVWSSAGQYLLFSDIPAGKVFQFHPDQGLNEYLPVSGFSNGLVINTSDSEAEQLILLQSRSRQVAVMQAPLDKPKANYQIMVSQFNGMRLNSPNDGVLSQDGSLLFTDPPYGLAQQLNDPKKELAFQGVYRLSKQHELSLIDDSLRYPNGVALAASVPSSDNTYTLYVAASNPQKPAWYQYTLNTDWQVIQRQVFHQLPPVKDEGRGLPDGLKVLPSGDVLATGPDGLWLFDHSGKLLAKVHLPSIAANLAFNDDYSTVFVTAHQHLYSLDLVKQPQ
ncbi:SMP-30/gluconolactonase/LRE family protein [Shewanella japonica]|uniref:SMP-30/gluconolactonase/LRE family protein n=1 Tax=Shewanella japonica TaxID=93973 RepID=UPI00249591D0|nr:SMP-30/gluconolactonase/LRE family protein [Shewanella japonica]